jgi:hypothetical protein
MHTHWYWVDPSDCTMLVGPPSAPWDWPDIKPHLHTHALKPSRQLHPAHLPSCTAEVVHGCTQALHTCHTACATFSLPCWP